MKKQHRKQQENFVLWRQKMYGSGEIVATVNDYLFTNWAFVIKCVGGSIINSAAPVKIAFLKPRWGWSLSREEPESVFLSARPGGRGCLRPVCMFVDVCVCVCIYIQYMCVALRETSVKTPYTCRPSCDSTEMYFLTPANRKTCKCVCACVFAEKHQYTWKSFICRNLCT